MAGYSKQIEQLQKTIDKLSYNIEHFDESVSTLGDKIKDKWTGGTHSQIRGKNRQISDLNLENEYLTNELSTTTDSDKKKWLNKQIELNDKKIKLEEKEVGQLKKAGKANLYGAIAGQVQKTAKEVMDMWVKLTELEYKSKKVNLDAAQKIAILQYDMVSKSLQRSLSVGVNGLMSSMQENSFKSTQNAIETGKQFLMSNIEIGQIQYERVINNQKVELEKMKMLSGVLNSAGQAVSSIPHPVTAIVGSAMSIVSGIMTAETDVKIMELEFEQSILEKEKEFEKKLVSDAADIAKNFSDLAQATDKLLMNLDTQANNTARMFGFSGRETENYVRAAAVLNREMAVMGKTFEDLNKMQSAYISESGRNVLMNGKEGQMMSAFGKLYNISDEESAQIMGAMNIFNTSIESGSDIMFEMYKTANRMGVSNQKFAKDMQKNLKIAEKYQFKGGVKGMMDMALWAQKTRFNMDSLSGALEKMHTGDIADVIQTSAKLNVLGGNAALLSDPMAMLYNAYADPAQYAKNMQQMIQGFGHFNSKTGETEFNINEQMRMEAMASALGVSKEDFFNMARQEKKLGNIKKVLGGRFSSDETDFITQNATFNKDTGQWEVNVMGANGELQRRDINTLTQEELDSIFPEDNQQQLVEYTKGIFSILEKNTATDYKYRSELAYRTQGAHSKKYENIRGSYDKHYSQYMDLYAGETNEWFKFDAEAIEKQLNQAGVYLEEGELGAHVREASLRSIDAQTEKIGLYSQAMYGVLNGNQEMLLAAMEKLDPILADNFKKVLENQEALVKYQEYMLDGTLTQNEITEIMKSDKARQKMAQDFGVKGFTDEEIISNLSSGRWVVKNGHIETKEGQRLKVTDTSYNAQKNNAAVNDAWFTDYQIAENAKAVLNPLSGFGKKWGWFSDDTANWIRWIEKAAGGNTISALQGLVTSQGRSIKTHDLIISPKHGIYETDPEDTIVASKPGGSLDRSSQRRGGLSDNVTLNITGSLTLSNGSQKIDLMELLRNDPNALRELTKEIIKEGSNTVFGGKHEWAPNRYTFS